MVTFIKNPEKLDDKLYCICKQKWDGKLMIECEKCDNWYHPECIGINEKDDVKLNMMNIKCSLCRLREKDEPEYICLEKDKGDGQHIKHNCHNIQTKKIKNMTSVGKILSQQNLENKTKNKIESKKIEDNQTNLINMTHSKTGNVFKISLNQTKTKENPEIEKKIDNSSLSPKRDLKIIEPFSEIVQNKPKISTQEIAQTQIQRVNKIYSQYYPSNEAKGNLKKLLNLMVVKKDKLLSKREFKGKCKKGSNCIQPSKKNETHFRIKRVKDQ